MLLPMQKAFNRILRAHKHLYEYLFSYKGCPDCEIFFNLRDSILSRHFSNVSRKA